MQNYKGRMRIYIVTFCIIRITVRENSFTFACGLYYAYKIINNKYCLNVQREFKIPNTILLDTVLNKRVDLHVLA